VLWRQRIGGSVKGAIASAGGRLYVGAYDGHVYCLSLAGKQLWRASGQRRLLGHGRFYSTPALAYGRVYIGSTDGKVYSFGATTGKLIWSHSTGGYVYGSPAVWDDRVFVGSYSGRFYAFDAATGEPRWTFDAHGKISGSATVIGNVVYFATLTGGARSKGRTYALNARTGKLLWSFPDGKYTPVAAVQGHLFLIGYGTVYGMVPR
jgi:outer membrane protein assembly factor BamB